ncbi:MAG: substrate-binding domain-containing protein [Treponema sp.]|nr:substrate-binding domain-containing protein [Treponema sp.]
MMQSKKELLYNISRYALVLLGLLAFLFSLFNAVKLALISRQINMGDIIDYSHHISFIAEDEKSSIVQEIYKYCKENEEYYNCALDLVTATNTNENLVSLVERVCKWEPSAIILYNPEQIDLGKLNTSTASGNSVPLVIIGNNFRESNAVSYIGVNNYESGKQFAEALTTLNKDGGTILALNSSERTENFYEHIFFSMRENLPTKFIIEKTNVSQKENISAEDIIRDILRFRTNVNAILCFSEEDSIRVSENLIELNLVDKITVIGFGNSERIQSYLKKGILSASISYQTDKIAEAALSSIFDYITYGNTGGYFPIPTILQVGVQNEK